jgi:hypothetical protein
MPPLDQSQGDSDVSGENHPVPTTEFSCYEFHPSEEPYWAACAWNGTKIVEDAIRFVYASMEPREAILAISGIWECLDRASELAAARMRILLARLPQPRQSASPQWFTDTDLSDASSSDSLDVCRMLVCACAASLGEFLPEAEAYVGPKGRIVLDWQLASGRLQWMVEASDIPWPAVKVYQVYQSVDGDRSSEPETRIFHAADQAIDSLISTLVTAKT